MSKSLRETALAAPEPEGDGRHVCPDCKNTFLQPFVCTTCGAQKLYDNTVLNLSNANEELRARCERLEAALEDITSYAVHEVGCMAGYYEHRKTGLEPYVPKGPCTCGLTASIKNADALRGK